MVISKEIFQGFRGSSTFSRGGGGVQLFPGKGGGFKYANFYQGWTQRGCLRGGGGAIQDVSGGGGGETPSTLILHKFL